VTAPCPLLPPVAADDPNLPRPPAGAARPPRADAHTGKILPGRGPGAAPGRHRSAQAEAVAERIGAIPKVTAIYTSPLERTRETAAPIALRLGLKPVVDPRPARGATSANGPDGSSRSSTRSRAGRACSAIRAASASRRGVLPRDAGPHRRAPWPSCRSATRRDIVAVSHADPIKAAVADAVGNPPRPVPAHRDLTVLGDGDRLPPT